MLTVRFKKTHPKAKTPTKATAGACCYDLYLAETVGIAPGETVIFNVGLQLEMPKELRARIYTRSGHSKKGLHVLHGVIDSDYRGDIGPIIHYSMPQRARKEILFFEAGERIAQIYFEKINPVKLVEVDELDSTERGTGGFGSTGK